MRRRLVSGLIGILALMRPAAADEAGGAVTQPPALASAAAPLRQALVIAPGALSVETRAQTLRRDGKVYQDLLRLLGFSVTTLSPATRPELDAGLRSFARGVAPGADVAVFVLGDVRPVRNELTLAPPGVAPDRVEADGLRLGGSLRLAAERGPRAVAVVIDDCVGTAETCSSALRSLPRGVGAVASRRGAEDADTLGATLPSAMTVEGRTLPQLREALRLLGSAEMPAGFAFLPMGFLAGLPLACNGVDFDLPAAALRGRPTLEPLAASCREAAARYAFSPFFGARLAIVREQEAARRALAACADAPLYLAEFPSGRYRAAIEEARRGCEAPPPAPAPPPLTIPQQKAVAAVAAYFRQHDYAAGDSFVKLSRLYGSEVETRGTKAPAAEHMRRVGAWYGGYDSVRFELLPASLDLLGCVREESCRVRGRYHLTALPAGASAYASREADFSLQLDLVSGKTLAECGVAEPTNSPTCD